MSINTSTTAGKIMVMQASEAGKVIQQSQEGGEWHTLINPLWDWCESEYRVKPETVEEAIKEFSKTGVAMACSITSLEIGFKAGAKWKEDQLK